MNQKETEIRMSIGGSFYFREAWEHWRFAFLPPYPLQYIEITVDFLTFLTQWIFLYFPQSTKERQCGNHYQCNDQENGKVIGLSRFGYQRGNQDQGNHAANRTHQVDDGIRLWSVAA